MRIPFAHSLASRRGKRPRTVLPRKDPQGFDPGSLALGGFCGVLAGGLGLPLAAAALAQVSPVSLAIAAGLALSAAGACLRPRFEADPSEDRYAYRWSPRPHGLSSGTSVREWLASEPGITMAEAPASVDRIRTALGRQVTPPGQAARPTDALLWVPLAMHDTGTVFREDGTTLGAHDVLREIAHDDVVGRNASEAYLGTLRTRIGEERWLALVACWDGYLRRHGTRETAFLGILESGRLRRGPMPCASFRWLKPVDRPLWYALQNLGRDTFYVEGLVAILHHAVECRLNIPIPAPDLDAAAAVVIAEAWRLREAEPARAAA